MSGAELRVGRRAPMVAFEFEGRRLHGIAGEPVAAALHVAGVRTLSRSFKYNRPRGLHCVADACPNCAMRVNGLPGVATCVTALQDGDIVSREHAWPTAEHSVLGIADASRALLSAGFQYRRLRRTPNAFQYWERVLARLAGHGRLPHPAASSAIRDRGAWTSRRVDVAIVGGGPAGLAAALAAETDGAEVLLVERDSELGGSLLAGDAGERALVARLSAQVASRPGIEVLAGATVIGSYEDSELGATSANGFVQIQSRSIVLASGTLERRWAFVDGDRPGVLLGHGAQTLLNRHGVLAGHRPIVATDEGYGYELAVLMATAGAEVACLIEARPTDQVRPENVAAAESAGVPLVFGASVDRVIGRRRMRRVGLGGAAGARQVEGDALLIAGGRRPALGLLRQRVGTAHAGAAAAGWHLAGGAAGTPSAQQAVESGRAAGHAAARLRSHHQQPEGRPDVTQSTRGSA